MIRNFTAAAAQFTPVSGDCRANLGKMLSLTDRAADAGASLIVFPELALTGYFLKREALRELSVPKDGEWSRPLREKAAERGIMIAAGYPERQEEMVLYNSCLLIGRDGQTVGNARKRYLWCREKKLFARGEAFEVFRTELGVLGVLLCYDLEYPEPARAVALKGADVILCPAAWSRRAEQRWRIETAANALFNLVYLVGANFTDENCCGTALIIGPDGSPLRSGGREGEEVVTAALRQDVLEKNRAEIPYRLDFRPETLTEAYAAGPGFQP